MYMDQNTNTGTGTLMAPQVLHKVIHGRPDPEPWQKDLLTFKPAVLHGYRRHRVRWATYPGVIPASESALDSESGSEASTRPSSVLGVVVSGLTDGDIYRLDQYEGDEYEMQPVKVRLIRNPSEKSESGAQKEDSPDSHLRDVLNAAGADVIDEKEEDVDAKTYIYTAGDGQLEDAEWDFESFKKEKMAWWIERNS